jgi:hypothetical protein
VDLADRRTDPLASNLARFLRDGDDAAMAEILRESERVRAIGTMWRLLPTTQR